MSVTTARTAANSQTAHLIARAGLAARGVIYLLIGWVAVMLALGQSGREADQRGALQMLARQPFGLFLLWLLGIGFVGYALWRLSEAAFGDSLDANSTGSRLRCLARAVVYASFAFTTFSVIEGGRGSQSRQESDLTATAMRHPGGQWAVGIVGAIIVIIGAALVLEGVRRKFLKYLRMSQMSARTRSIVMRLGQIGTVARGLVFAFVGALFIDAAVTYQPSKAGGLGTALSTLRDQSFGPVVLIAAALGLIIFGAYGLCEARWRKV